MHFVSKEVVFDLISPTKSDQ